LPVLLLDEPTSALDGPSQARLLEAIARLRGKRTVILVTHRPEPLAIADLVVRLEPEASRARSGREHVDRRSGRDLELVRTEEVTVEDVRAAAGEPQP